MKTNKNVKQWLAIVMVGLFTFLSVIQAVPLGMENRGIDVEASGKYNNSELTSVLPSAYFETKNSVTGDGDKFGDSSKQFRKNIQEVSGRHFGNIGLFVGFPGDSQSQLAALNTSNAISINEANNHFNNDDVKKYYAFGAAVQDLSQKGIRSDKIEESSQRTIDGIASAAKSLTKAGARLVSDYNPAPIVLSLYRTENGPKGIDLRNYPENKLVQIVVNNEALSGMLNLIRTPPTGSDSANATLFTWIVFLMVVLLVVAGVLMKVMNGRAAGESYRKAVVKIVVSTLAVPLIASLLNFGVTTFVEVTDPDVTPEEEYAEQAIGEHLNFADWYATGFAVPDGMELTIKDDKFVLSQGHIRAINEYSYGILVGTPSPMLVYDRLISAGDQNYAQPSFVEKDGWDGMAVKAVGDTIIKNVEGEDTDAEGGRGILSKIFGGSVGSYMYGFRNEMSGSDGSYKVTVGTPDSDAQQSNAYGMSPLASYNMMRSTFSGGNITSSLAKPQMASVVYSAYVGSDGGQMNRITKLVATFAMVMAAMKGLASIFTAGIGGIFGGAAGSGLGSSAAAGQGVGGVIALVGGVIGMGLIMNISFIFLDELHRIFFDIFQGTAAGDPNMLDPLRDMADNLPGVLKILKVPIKSALENLSTLVITIASIIALPKFGKIPINVFSQKMSDLPANFADKAQRMENRFTGDYRAGGGGRSSSSAAFNSQMTEIGGETFSQMKGVGAAAAAGGGMLLGMAGGGIASLGDKIMGDEEEGDKSMNISTEDPEGPEDPTDGGPGEGENTLQAVEEHHEGVAISTDEHVDGDNLDGDQGDQLSSVDGDPAGKGEDKTGIKEGGTKEAIKDSKSSRDTQAGPKDSISGGAVTGSGPQIDGDQQSVEGDQSVAGDHNTDKSVDGSGEYSNVSDIEGNQSVAGERTSLDQSGGASQEFAGDQSVAGERTSLDQSGGASQEFAGDERSVDATNDISSDSTVGGSSIAGGSNINTGGSTDISSEVGGRSDQFAGDQRQSISQADKHNTAVDAGSNVHSSLSADQNSSVHQSQNTTQDSDSYVNSQRSSINTGSPNVGGQGKSVSGQGASTPSGKPSGQPSGQASMGGTTTPAGGGGTGQSKSVNPATPNPRVSDKGGQSQAGSNLKTGKPSIAKKTDKPQVKAKQNQNPASKAPGNVSQTRPNTQTTPDVASQTQSAPAAGGPPHNPPKDTVNTQVNKGGDKPKVEATPAKKSGFRMKAGKLTKTVGESMQGAGGEVSKERVASAIKHGAASAFVGGHTQQKTQAGLNRAQGRPNAPIEETPKEKTKPNTSTRGGGLSRRENEILLQEEQEDARRK